MAWSPIPMLMEADRIRGEEDARDGKERDEHAVYYTYHDGYDYVKRQQEDDDDLRPT